MRHIVKSGEVVHLWAAQSQDWAANATRNISFDGPTIRSYRTPMGRIVETPAGPVAVLNRNHYSSTTAGHQRDIAYAVRHLPRYSVPTSGYRGGNGSELEPATARETWARVIAEAGRDFHGARNGVGKRNRLAKWLAEIDAANAFAGAFGLERFPRPEGPEIASNLEKLRADRDARDRRRDLAEIANAERYAERERYWAASQAERAAMVAADLETWIAGGPTGANLHGATGDYLRVDPRDPSQAETTRGARVPLAHIRRIAETVLRMIAAGRTYQTNGHSIHFGPYTLQSIDAAGNVQVGCHTFTRAEIERFAATINAPLDFATVIQEVETDPAPFGPTPPAANPYAEHLAEFDRHRAAVAVADLETADAS